MEELNKYNENLIYFIQKLDLLIKKLEDIYFVLKDCNEKSKEMGIKLEYIYGEQRFSEEIKEFKDNFINNLDNIDIIDVELENKIKELDIKIDSIINKADEIITDADTCLCKEIYRQVIKAIYVSKWRQKDIEISYLDYKDTIISKLVGEAKFRKLSIEKRKLEKEQIKREFYEEIEKYNKESIKEIIVKLINNGECDFEVIELKNKLMKVFKIDEKILRYYVPKNEWKAANLVPHGIIEKLKYYNRLNKIISNEIRQMRKNQNETIEMKFVEQNIKKVINLNIINQEIKQITM